MPGKSLNMQHIYLLNIGHNPSKNPSHQKHTQKKQTKPKLGQPQTEKKQIEQIQPQQNSIKIRKKNHKNLKTT
jgi:hypothetical protein